MAEGEQLPCERAGAGAVLRHHGVEREPVLADQRDAPAGRLEGLELAPELLQVLAVGEAAAGEDRGARALGAERREVLELAQRAAQRAPERHGQVMLLGRAHGAGGDRREVRVADVLHDEADDVGVATRHRLRLGVGRVVERGRRLDDLGAERGPHPAVAAAVTRATRWRSTPRRGARRRRASRPSRPSLSLQARSPLQQSPCSVSGCCTVAATPDAVNRPLRQCQNGYVGKRLPKGRSVMTERLGIVMNGVTGRMGYRQHLVRSILAIRDRAGVELADGTRVHGRADAGRPQRGQAARHRGAARAAGVDDRPRRGARRRRRPTSTSTRR